MQEGPSDYIQFLGTDGTCYRATLTDTDITLGGFLTIDSRWLVSSGGSHGKEEGWISYCAHDHSTGRARVRCRLSPVVHQGRLIDTWFEHERGSGWANHEDSRIGFLGWEGDKWIATIQMVREPFPAAPKFELRRV